jgi:hypothetical protein
MVAGLLLARHVSLPRIAAALQRVQPHTRPPSLERRLRRILADPHLTVATTFVPLARFSLRHLPAGRCLVILDDTTQTTHAHLTMLALAYRGRALPLAWVRWTGPLHGGYWTQVAACIAQASTILPPQVQPCLLADRGLACPRLARLARAAGWDYVLRVQGSLRVPNPAAPAERIPGATLLPAPGHSCLIWGGLRRPWQQAQAAGLAGRWTAGQRVPWLVVSNLPPSPALVALYARRMQIEACFRDLKSGGFAWEASRVHHPDHAARLLLALMLAVLVGVLLGEQTARRTHPAPARPSSRSLLRRGLDLLLAPPGSHRGAWVLHPPRQPVLI